MFIREDLGYESILDDVEQKVCWINMLKVYVGV